MEWRSSNSTVRSVAGTDRWQCGAVTWRVEQHVVGGKKQEVDLALITTPIRWDGMDINCNGCYISLLCHTYIP
jgi:hypothetical protein